MSDEISGRALADAAAHHLKYSLGKDVRSATVHDRFVALCYAVRDRLIERWIETQRVYQQENVKRACYLSLEYLLGRSLESNLIALGLLDQARQALLREGVSLDELIEQEPDPGLGNGGLGRLAACILEGLSSLDYPAIGYGLRYEFGLFRQRIRDGSQLEEPDHWLERGWPWELARDEYTYPVVFGGRVVPDPADPLRYRWVEGEVLLGTAHDVPVAGHATDTVNTLRLWSARAARAFDLQDFSHGDYAAAVEHKVAAENLTKVLYPDDRIYAGRELRLRQQYLLVSCSVQDVLRRHRALGNPLRSLPDKVALQLNDTHPSLVVVELLRLLLDREQLSWDEAWEITRRTVNYTNHTLLSEALEQWPVEMLERVLPRHLQLIYELNRRFLEEVAARWPGDAERARRMSLIEEQPPRRVRMAHLATLGSQTVNGVSEIHSELLRGRVLRDFAQMFPERFTNVTNGVTPRRWLLQANPRLSALISERLGSDAWVQELGALSELAPLADDAGFQEEFRRVKRANKEALSSWTAQTTGLLFDPGALLDVHVKRLHEYKRQLLNLLHVAHLHRRLREEPGFDVLPRTVLFAAKAAPGYEVAKRIIRLIHAVAAGLEADPAVGGRLRVVFLPDYRVSLAERIIPAAELSQQISTAGSEASGTGNMKLGLNGAITLGTLDGAQLEMRAAVGEEQMVSFGLNAAEVAAVWASGRNAGWELYHEDEQVRRTVDFLFSGIYPLEREVLSSLRDQLLVRSDPWLHLADLKDYARAQAEVERRARDEAGWTRTAILNVARLGGFSVDRTVNEYARRIWNLERVPIDLARKRTFTRLFLRGGS